MIRGRLTLFVILLLSSCVATSQRVDPFGAVPDDFSVDLTILSRPEGDQADRRTSRIMLEPDGSLRYMAKRGIGPNTIPPLIRRLDREQMARVWDSAARLGLTNPAEADVDADVRRVKPPSRRGCVWLLVLTGNEDRWNFMRSASGTDQPDAAIVAFGRELGALAWAPDRGTRLAAVEPVRWDYGPDPWAAYKGATSEPVLVAKAVAPPPSPKPAPKVEPPPPPAPKPAPKADPPPPPTPKPAPKVDPPPPPTPKPAPKVEPPPPAPKPAPKVEPPPPPPAPKPAPKVVPPPPPTPKPAPKVDPPPPPTPKPAPKVEPPPPPPASKPAPKVEPPPPAPKPAPPPPPAPKPAPKVEPPPPPAPKPAPKVEPPPPAPKPAPKVEPPPPPAPKPAPKVEPPPPPAPKPAPKVEPPPPTPKPAPKVEPPPPTPKPAPKVEPLPPPRWPLDIRRVEVSWLRTHEDLPSMDICLTQLIRFDQDGHRLTAPSRKRGGVELSINEINGAGGATFEPSAMWLIQQRILACTEFSGLIGARIQLRLERTRERGGPFDLWVLVEVPFLGTEPANNIPAKLLVLPAVQNGAP